MAEQNHTSLHNWPNGPVVHSFAPWRTPFTALVQRAREHGDAPLLTAVSRNKEETELTYRMADVASRSIAAWLTAEFGGRRGPLALAPTNDVPSVLAVLGALRAGFSVLMLGPSDPPERRALQMAAVDALALLHAPGSTAPQDPRALVLPDWRSSAVDPRAQSWRDPEIEPEADALFFATSGSTAASKIVAQTHRNTVANAEALRRHHSLSDRDRILGCLPIHHVNGMHFTVLGAMMAGAHTVLAESFSPLTYPGLLTTYRPRIASVVPSVLETLVEMWRRPRMPGNFDYFVTAAAPLTAGTARAVVDRLGAKVLQGYGLSETTNFSTTLPSDLSDASYARLMLDTNIPSVGIALPGNDVAVLDGEGSPLPVGEVGEVCIRGLNVMARYAGNEPATKEAFRGDWFHSGDLGYRIEEGGRDFFVLTGRIKNIAKVAGETVSLEEMDRRLRALPQVRDAACIAVPARFAGERIVAAVVLAQDVDPASLTAPLRAHFPESLLPDRVVALQEIQRTPTGKVLRPQLRSALEAVVPVS